MSKVAYNEKKDKNLKIISQNIHIKRMKTIL